MGCKFELGNIELILSATILSMNSFFCTIISALKILPPRRSCCGIWTGYLFNSIIFSLSPISCFRVPIEAESLFERLMTVS